MKTIYYPKLLFRYRFVNTRNLDALRANKLYFFSANYSDNPFDTFLNIDIEHIQEIFNQAFKTTESIGTILNTAKVLLNGILSKEKLK